MYRMLVIVNLITATVGLRLSINYAEQSSLPRCAEEHPAFNEDYKTATTAEFFDCYKTWHNAKLNALRQHKDCSVPPVSFVRVNHGLGDTGGYIMNKFKRAMEMGTMFMLLFDQQHRNVWQDAMDLPFEMDLEANKDIFCLDQDKINSLSDEKDIGEISGQTKHTPELQFKHLFFSLMPPTAEVLQRVEAVMSKVKPGEKLLGVHFRSQWAHEHHACGCKDLREIAQCAGNMHAFAMNNSKTHIFVAADQENGILAFERAFGKSNMLTISSEYPIEHSLDVSKEGAIRIYADMLVLAKADAMLGSCGSTFTSIANHLSDRQSQAVITGSPEAKQCASMQGETRDLSGFASENFVRKGAMHACDCYAPQDHLEGTCVFQCDRSPSPSKCASWQLATPSFYKNLQPQEPGLLKTGAMDKTVPWQKIKGFN